MDLYGLGGADLMSKRNKSTRILLSILLCGCMANYASAQTYTFDTYTVEDGTASCTYTDAEGVEHTITYKTVTAAKNDQAESTSYETSYSNEGAETYYSGDDGTTVGNSWTYDIHDTDVTFEVNYSYNETLVTEGGTTYTDETKGISYIDGTDEYGNYDCGGGPLSAPL